MSKYWLLRLFEQLLLLMIVTSSRAATKQYCPESCGNVTIPYPFGIGDGCHLPGLDVTCNTSFTPHKPFIGNTTVELQSILLSEGQARVYKHIEWACYNHTDFQDFHQNPLDLRNNTAYRISSTNKFISLGCRTVSLVAGYQTVGPNAQTFVGGCVSVCLTKPSENGTCTGYGCCETDIPKGLSYIVTDNLFLLNITGGAWQENECGYVFIAEEGWYNFSSKDLTGYNFNETYKDGVPVVLDWSIGNQSCNEAQRNKTSYACLDSNSVCVNSTNGDGYFCNCSTGYEGNPYLKDGCKDINECLIPRENKCYIEYCTNTPGNYTCLCPPNTSGDPTKENGCSSDQSSFPAYAKALVGILSVLIVIILGFWMHWRLQRAKLMNTKHKFFIQNGGFFLRQQMHSHQGSVAFRIFEQQELEKATEKFDASRILGLGGHGTVYKGILDNNRIVAIKKSKVMNENQTKEFAKEMLILSQINHKNVIKLLGCCLEVEVPMLVYEFIPNGNLYQYIHSNRLSIPLSTRLRIAVESANALAYLHSSASPPIIHGDVKSSNILLDQEFAAKVSDFGASKIAPKDHEQIATLVQGTCGYLDPEYLLTCQLTEKSDVYSFGVVILELLTRRKVLDFNASGEDKNLVPCFLLAMKEDKFFEVLDVELKNEDVVLMKEVAKIVLQCLRVTGDERPTMKEVAEGLERLLKLKKQQTVEQTNYYSAEKANNSFATYSAENKNEESIGMGNESTTYRHGSFEVQGLLNIEGGR